MPGNPATGLREKVLVLLLAHRTMTAARLAPIIWPRGDLRTLIASAGGLLGRMRRDGLVRKLSDRPPIFVLTPKGITRAQQLQAEGVISP